MNPHSDCAGGGRGRYPVRRETAAVKDGGGVLWADIAVTGAGGTCWKLAFLGVPMSHSRGGGKSAADRR